MDQAARRLGAGRVSRILGSVCTQTNSSDESPLNVARTVPQHHRLCPLVHPDKRVRSVAVGRHNSRIFVGEDVRFVFDLVERSFLLRAACVDGIFIHRCIVREHRQRIGCGLLYNDFDLIDGWFILRTCCKSRCCKGG